MIIYIEGNIGTGKSTFVDKLASYLPNLTELNVDPKLILEPVDEWLKTTDSDGQHILQKFYGDQTKWAFTFQMNSFISRVKRIQDEMFINDNGKEKMAFVERSIYTDRNCFAKLCHESGKMTTLEYDIYCKWNEWLSQQFNIRPDVYIYLHCLSRFFCCCLLFMGWISRCCMDRCNTSDTFNFRGFNDDLLCPYKCHRFRKLY